MKSSESETRLSRVGPSLVFLFLIACFQPFAFAQPLCSQLLDSSLKVDENRCLDHHCRVGIGQFIPFYKTSKYNIPTELKTSVRIVNADEVNFLERSERAANEIGWFVLYDDSGAIVARSDLILGQVDSNGPYIDSEKATLAFNKIYDHLVVNRPEVLARVDMISFVHTHPRINFGRRVQVQTKLFSNGDNDFGKYLRLYINLIPALATKTLEMRIIFENEGIVDSLGYLAPPPKAARGK